MRKAERGYRCLHRYRRLPSGERIEIIEEFLVVQVAGVFGIETSKVDRKTPLTNLGLDSLMAVELMTRIESELGMSIPMGGVLRGPNVELAQIVLDLIAETAETPETSSEDTRSTLNPLEHGELQTDSFSLTPGQRAMLSDSQCAVHRNLSCAAVVSPKVNVERLRMAFRCVAKRHPMVRARIISAGDEFSLQISHENVDICCEDAKLLSAKQVSAKLADRTNQPFDLQSGPLVRLELLQRQDTDVILLCMHPVIADAWSTTIVFRDLIEAYSSDHPTDIESPTFTYQDYVIWQSKVLSHDTAQRMAEYWDEQLEGGPCKSNLATDRPLEFDKVRRSASMKIELKEDLTLGLLRFSAEQNVSLRETLFSALTILVHGHTHQDDILISYRFEGRSEPELNDIVGEFENWKPIRSQLKNDLTISDFIAETSQRTKLGEKNQQVPWTRLLERLDFGDEPGTMPGAQIRFAMPRFGFADEQRYALFQIGRHGHTVNLHGHTFETIDVFPDGNERQVEYQNGAAPQAGSDVALEVGEACGRVLGWWHYNSDLFDAATVSRLNEDLCKILQKMVEDPARSVSQLLPENFSTGTAATEPGRITLRSSAGAEVDFENEIQLDPSISPSGPSSRAAGPSRLFLTGATGFIGAYLLKELLERTDSEIVCLVRARDEHEGMRRVRENLASYDLHPPGFEHRVTAIIGDFSKPLFGMPQVDFDRLASEIDVVYHNGADVNLVLPYQSLKSVNVFGTREVLRLACHIHTKPTHVVSTFTVQTTEANCGRVVTETDPLPPCEELLHGYSQTKWVSEKMIDICAAARSTGRSLSAWTCDW